MEYLSLYRKWRPQSFAQDFVGQEHVVRTLRNALLHNQVAHAYLFTGPRGTGKTSAAKILAKAVNCSGRGEKPDPCNQCPSCQRIADGVSLDVMEIDGASNRGIDEVRDLREKVKFAPVEGNYKVYIIDEVHMLTTEAFNALLKTLEEPPPHVIFIFATTEIHKVPSTILSRCQRFDFKRLTVEEIVGHLTRLAQAEGLEAQEEALHVIGRETDGGMRDAIGLLEQGIAYAEGKLTAGDVRAVLGLAENEALMAFGRAIAAHDPAAGLAVIEKAGEEGKDPALFARQLARFFRDLLFLLLTDAEVPLNLNPEEKEPAREIAKSIGTTQLQKGIALFLEAGLTAKRGNEGSLPLEMALIQLLTEEEPPEKAPLAGRLAQLEARLTKLEQGAGPIRPESRKISGTRETLPSAPLTIGSSSIRSVSTGDPAPVRTFDQWEAVLAAVKKKKRTTEALLREGTPKELRGDSLEIQFSLQFHWERIKQPEYADLVREALQEVTGEKIIPKFTLREETAKGEEERPELVRKTLELFGGKITEVKEEEP